MKRVVVIGMGPIGNRHARIYQENPLVKLAGVCDIIRERAALGWTQRELARRAGIAFETLCRIETGNATPSVPTIRKIDQALKQAGKRKGK